MSEEHTAENDARYEADVLIEAGHPSRPDREELMRHHIARIKALAWAEGYQTCCGDFDIAARSGARSSNPYRVIPPGEEEP